MTKQFTVLADLIYQHTSKSLLESPCNGQGGTSAPCLGMAGAQKSGRRREGERHEGIQRERRERDIKAYRGRGGRET